MDQKDQDKRIDYIEFKVADIARAKTFYSSVFGWSFTDYGEAYASFNDGSMRGGLEQVAEVNPGGALIVFYALDLLAIQEVVLANGGTVVRDIFEFPGGRRFHFKDTEGNELAIWSDIS